MEFEKVKEAVNETFIARNESFNYKIEVLREEKAIKSVTVGVTEKTETGEMHVGHMSLHNGNKNTSFIANREVIPHIEVFEEFLESQTRDE